MQYIASVSFFGVTMVITSLTNAKVMETAKLNDKKYRKSSGRYVIEGERLVADAFKYGAKIVEVFVKESVANKFNYENQIVVVDKVFEKLSDTVNSQGILAVAEKPTEDDLTPTGNCLVLDGLQDPGNVGTLLRTAVACGFTDVYAVNSVDMYSPKVLRSAMSAHMCVKLHVFDNLEQVYTLLKDVQIVVADMDGENVFDAKFGKHVALVVGNEGNGISQISKDNADLVVSLPMENNFESLNAAVAGSVIMYQIYSQK